MRTTKLTKAGREWKACCPFHNEKTPSFYVNDDKGFYHCFGCGAHGDAIRWMTDQRGLAFMDAVKELAAEAGLEVPAPDPRAAEQAEERARAARGRWRRRRSGSSPTSTAPRARGRALTSQRAGSTRTRSSAFGFGYAPDGRQALKEALARFDEPHAGRGRHADRGRGQGALRPLPRPADACRSTTRAAGSIAFGGRILDADKKDAPKYLNSPDTPLFDKGRTLYNLDRAGPASRKSGRIIVVEGYMDVIALAAAGFDEAVAPLGTALTERQIELLWRLAEMPMLCFDGDAAGQRAAMRAAARALPLLRPAHSLQFVTPARRDGPRRPGQAPRAARRSRRCSPSPPSLLDTLWAHERDAGPLATPEDKAGLKARLLEHVETIADPDIRSLYRRDLLDRFSAFAFPPSASSTKREFTPGKRWQPGRPAAPGASEQACAARPRDNPRDTLAQAVLAGLVRHPAEIARHAEALLSLAPADAAAVDAAIDELLEGRRLKRRSHHIGAAGILDAATGQRFASPSLSKATDPATAREDLDEAIALLVERPAVEAALAEATARFETDPDGAFIEQQRLRQRKLAIEVATRADGPETRRFSGVGGT